MFLAGRRHIMWNSKTISRQQFLAAYDSYADAIYRHCFYRVFSKPLAEELTQDTFMKTWQYLEGGKEVENLRAFLYRVANNLVIDYSRKKKEERLDLLLEKSADIEPTYDGRQDIETAELAKEVIDQMQFLKEDERQIISMRYIDQLELKEIADVLDITVNNVSVRLNRALKALREELDESIEP
jgi:RNA polymerase sigma-70 factor (ECF subfamily)